MFTNVCPLLKYLIIMKKLILSIIICFSTIIIATAQDYSTGIGLRGGLFYGLTVKHFLDGKAAIEGLLSTRWSGLEITGLYEIHNQIPDVERLNWYFGGGAHMGFYNGKNATWGETGTNYTNIGIDGILGLEYNFKEAPLNLSIDWKPAINIIGYSGFWGDNGALSIRYVF